MKWNVTWMMLVLVGLAITPSYLLGQDPSNSANPYDEVGFHHNQALAYVYSNFGDGEMRSNPERVCALGKEYFSQTPMIQPVGDQFQFPCPSNDQRSVDDLGLSEEAEMYFRQLESMVLAYGDSDAR